MVLAIACSCSGRNAKSDDRFSSSKRPSRTAMIADFTCFAEHSNHSPSGFSIRDFATPGAHLCRKTPIHLNASPFLRRRFDTAAGRVSKSDTDRPPAFALLARISNLEQTVILWICVLVGIDAWARGWPRGEKLSIHSANLHRVNHTFRQSQSPPWQSGKMSIELFVIPLLLSCPAKGTNANRSFVVC